MMRRQQQQDLSIPLIPASSFPRIRFNGMLQKRGEQGMLCSGDVTVFENKGPVEEGWLKGTECL